MLKAARPALTGMALAIGGLASTAASGHHSSAMYDSQQEVSLIGTVREFQWTNPHCWIQLIVTDANGRATEWSLETVSPPGLRKKGWVRDAVKAGDKATAVIHPLKAAGPGGQLVSLTVNGKMIGDGPL